VALNGGEHKNAYRVLVWRTEEDRDCLEHTGVDEMTWTVKYRQRKISGGSCDQDKEPSGSTKLGEFF
jgi:hypothetical protein